MSTIFISNIVIKNEKREIQLSNLKKGLLTTKILQKTTTQTTATAKPPPPPLQKNPDITPACEIKEYTVSIY